MLLLWNLRGCIRTGRGRAGQVQFQRTSASWEDEYEYVDAFLGCDREVGAAGLTKTMETYRETTQ